MPFVPLRDVWARHGEAAVVFGALVDAGFHPVSECDLHGWMHFYKWPLGSQRPVTILIPEVELAEASAFLAAGPTDQGDESAPTGATFWSLVHAGAGAFFALWIVLMLTLAI